MLCETVSIQLAEVAEGDAPLALETGRHVDGCLRCQAELAQYRKLLRALTSLREHHLFVDDTLLDEVLEVIRPAAPVHKLHRLNYRNKKVAYIGGFAAAATAGAAAGAIVIASRLASRQSLAS
ncbi:MAG: hypothetical protein ACRBK7_02495 [Acidimicrobiales bacterium]